MEQWIRDILDQWGAVAVLACRMIPGLRTLISVPAGFAEMPLGRFCAFTAIGIVMWTALLAGIGYWLGDNYGDLAGTLGWVSTVVLLAMFAWWLFRLVKQRTHAKAL